MVNYAANCLLPEQISSVEDKVRNENQREEQEREAKRHQLRQNRFDRNKAQQEAARLLSRRILFIGGASAFGLGVLILMIVGESALGFILIAIACLAALIGASMISSDDSKARPPQIVRRKQSDTTLATKPAPDSYGLYTFTVDLSTVYEEELDEAIADYPNLLKIVREDERHRVYEAVTGANLRNCKTILEFKLPGIRITRSPNIGN